MIPRTLLGLVLFAASLGPGYLYIKVAERRATRPARSALLEAVELIVIGGICSTLGAMAVLSIADTLGFIDIEAFIAKPEPYLVREPFKGLGSLLAFFVLSYTLGAVAAYLLHGARRAEIAPGSTAWQRVFYGGRSSPNDLTVVLIELRDGRRVAGVLASFTLELEDRREIALREPIAASPGPGRDLTTLKDKFLLLREEDILYIVGNYWPGVPRPRGVGRIRAIGRWLGRR